MKTAVVTGSASGIGACVKDRLKAQGYNVIGIDLKGASINADLSTPEGRRDAVDQAQEMSCGKIDRLVLAAGLGGHIADGALVAKVNYFGAVAILDGLKDTLMATSGRCVVICSNSAQMFMDPENPIITALLEGDEDAAMKIIGNQDGTKTYATSKHALTRAVRRRSALWGEDGITLNAIAPGQTATPMQKGAAEHPTIGKAVAGIPIPKKRLASPDEMAGVIEFMLSDAADYMQGSVIYVDGGTDAQLRPDGF